MELRSSSIGTFMGCPKKYEYEYELGYESVDDNWILLFGTGIHASCEARGNGKDISAQRSDFRAAVKPIPAYQKTIGECLVMLYNEAYKTEGIEYKHVEYAFSIEVPCKPYWKTLPDGTVVQKTHFNLRGKFDGLCVDSQGRWFIMEHKTTRGDITDSGKYWVRREMNPQIDLYMWAARKLGFPVEYMLYDVIKVPSMRPYKATPVAKREFYKRDGKYGKKGDPKPTTKLRNEGTDEFRQRVMDYVLENGPDLLRREKIERSGKDNQDTLLNLKDIQTIVATMARPKNKDHCLAYGSECEFKPVCKNETNLGNPALYQRNEDPLGY